MTIDKARLPRKDFSDVEATISITEFRQTPGDIFDLVKHGATIHIEKNGRHIASIIPAPTIIKPNGSWTGKRPLTMGKNL